MAPVIYSVKFKALRMALKAVPDLASPNKAFSFEPHLLS